MTKLFLIPGHGAGDPGAGGNGYNEAERVRALAQRIHDLAPNNVILADFNRNYYADGGVNNLNVDKDTLVVELHMDSASAAAKGAHVIIKEGYKPDWFDNALAQKLAAYMPGRSNSIVGRSNLANINRAANRGINYRLVENGFITNAGDVAKFNDLDTMARIYLEAAGIATASTPAPEPYVPKDVYTVDNNGANPYQYWWIRGEVKDKSVIAIRNNGSWNWLSDPNSSSKPNTPVQCWPGTENNVDPRAPQLWVVHAVSGKPGVYTLAPKVAPQLRLDNSYNEPKAGSRIQLYPANESEAQEFIFYRDGNGKYRIVSVSGFKPIAVK